MDFFPLPHINSQNVESKSINNRRRGISYFGLSAAQRKKDSIEEITKVQLFKTGFTLILDDLEDLIQSPEKWEERMIEDFSNRPVVTTNGFNEWIRKFTKETPVETARKQLDELGYILDFSDHFDIIAMNPIWLADTFKSILSFKFVLHFHSSILLF